MHKALAQEQAKRIRELAAELRGARDVEERLGIATRITNLLPGLYVVHSGAGQHIEEAVAKLRYPQAAIVNAALATIESAVSDIEAVLASHAADAFTRPGTGSRLFAKPVSAAELRSIVEKGRLLHNEHHPFITAIDAPSHVESVLLSADRQTLLPVLQRMGFPDSQALVFFTTRVQPHLVKPAGNIQSLCLATIRSGAPAHVVKHRVLA